MERWAARTSDLNWPRTIILAVCLVHAVALAPFVLRGTPVLNDDVLHMATTRAAAFGLQGEGVAGWLDPYEPSIVEGYPFFHAYPPLGHLAVAGVSTVMHVPLDVVHRVAKWLLLFLMPWALYAGMRRMGLRARPALIAAVLSHFITTNGSHGFDFGSYTWRGFGLYAQLWATPFFVLSLGFIRLAVKRGRSLLLTGVFVGLTALAHVVYGYMLALTTAAWVVVCLAHRARRFKAPVRAAMFGAVSLLISGFFVIPGYVDRVLTNPSVWMPKEKLDSTGHEKILGDWIHGQFLDQGRLPILTIAVAIGLIAVVVRRRERRPWALVAFFVGWLLLFFGRPTWGVWVDRVLPLSHDVHLSRFVGAVHFGALALAAFGLDSVLHWGRRLYDRAGEQAAWLVLAAAVGVMLGDRVDYFHYEKVWQQEVEEKIAKEQGELDQLWQYLRSHGAEGERIYAGLPSNWGKSFGFGYVPIYAEVVNHGLPSLGYLYHVMALNADIMALFDESRANDYTLFGVGWVIAPTGKEMPKFLERQAAFGRFVVYRAPAKGLIGAGVPGQRLEGPQRDWYGSASRHFRSAERTSLTFPLVKLEAKSTATSLVNYQPQAVTGIAPPTLTQAQRLSATHYKATSEGSADGLVFLRTAYHPNWHVRVDGAEATLENAFPSNAAVRVSAGKHVVEFEYRADPQKPKWLVGGWLIVAVLFVLRRYQPLRRIAM